MTDTKTEQQLAEEYIARTPLVMQSVKHRELDFKAGRRSRDHELAQRDADISRLQKQVDIATDCLDSMTETVHPIHPANKWADVALEKMKAAEGGKL